MRLEYVPNMPRGMVAKDSDGNCWQAVASPVLRPKFTGTVVNYFWTCTQCLNDPKNCYVLWETTFDCSDPASGWTTPAVIDKECWKRSESITNATIQGAWFYYSTVGTVIHYRYVMKGLPCATSATCVDGTAPDPLTDAPNECPTNCTCPLTPDPSTGEYPSPTDDPTFWPKNGFPASLYIDFDYVLTSYAQNDPGLCTGSIAGTASGHARVKVTHDFGSTTNDCVWFAINSGVGPAITGELITGSPQYSGSDWIDMRVELVGAGGGVCKWRTWFDLANLFTPVAAPFKTSATLRPMGVYDPFGVCVCFNPFTDKPTFANVSNIVVSPA